MRELPVLLGEAPVPRAAKRQESAQIEGIARHMV
jgi:hypothetical protein